MDYGTDLLLVDDDIVFTPDGDIELVSGPACIAQDIDQELKIAPGTLGWDKAAGSSMLLMLGDSQSDAAAVVAELERVAIEDERVEPSSVKATALTDGKTYRLEFTPLAAVSPETLDFDLGKGD
jgi:hypothetical protein